MCYSWASPFTLLTDILLQDLAENGVEIELMHIGSSFDVSAFYQVSTYVTSVLIVGVVCIHIFTWFHLTWICQTPCTVKPQLDGWYLSNCLGTTQQAVVNRKRSKLPHPPITWSIVSLSAQDTKSKLCCLLATWPHCQYHLPTGKLWKWLRQNYECTLPGFAWAFSWKDVLHKKAAYICGVQLVTVQAGPSPGTERLWKCCVFYKLFSYTIFCCLPDKKCFEDN